MIILKIIATFALLINTVWMVGMRDIIEINDGTFLGILVGHTIVLLAVWL